MGKAFFRNIEEKIIKYLTKKMVFKVPHQTQFVFFFWHFFGSTVMQIAFATICKKKKKLQENALYLQTKVFFTLKCFNMKKRNNKKSIALDVCPKNRL